MALKSSGADPSPSRPSTVKGIRHGGLGSGWSFAGNGVSMNGIHYLENRSKKISALERFSFMKNAQELIAACRLLSVFHGHVLARIRRANVVGARADQPVVIQLLDY